MSGASIALRVAGVLAAIAILAGVIFGIRWYTAEPSGRLNAREQIFDGSNIIAQYDYFHSTCGAIRAQQQNIATTEKEIKSGLVKGRALEDLQTSLVALKYSLAPLITEYEGKAGSGYTAGQFREAFLPQTIPQKGVVTCEQGQQ